MQYTLKNPLDKRFSLTRSFFTRLSPEKQNAAFHRKNFKVYRQTDGLPAI